MYWLDKPISGTASDVGGIVSATRSRNTVNDSRTVTPTTTIRVTRYGIDKTFTQHTQGLRRVKKSAGSNTHPWRSREREPIVGVWGEPPAGVQEAEPPVGGGGVGSAKPPKADEVFVFKIVIFNASATVLHKMMYCLSCFFCKVSKQVSKFIVSTLK